MTTPIQPFMILYRPWRKAFAIHSGGYRTENKLRPCLVTVITDTKMRMAPCLTARPMTKVRIITLYHRVLALKFSDGSLVMERCKLGPTGPSSPHSRPATFNGFPPPPAICDAGSLDADILPRVDARRWGVDWNCGLQEARGAEEGQSHRLRLRCGRQPDCRHTGSAHECWCVLSSL